MYVGSSIPIPPSTKRNRLDLFRWMDLSQKYCTITLLAVHSKWFFDFSIYVEWSFVVETLQPDIKFTHLLSVTVMLSCCGVDLLAAKGYPHSLGGDAVYYPVVWKKCCTHDQSTSASTKAEPHIQINYIQNKSWVATTTQQPAHNATHTFLLCRNTRIQEVFGCRSLQRNIFTTATQTKTFGGSNDQVLPQQAESLKNFSVAIKHPRKQTAEEIKSFTVSSPLSFSRARALLTHHFDRSKDWDSFIK